MSANTDSGNSTKDLGNGTTWPTVWHLVKANIDNMADQAFKRSHLYVSESSSLIKQFRLRLESYLSDPLKNVPVGPRRNLEFQKTMHEEIMGAVEGAVDSAMNDFNMTSINSSARQTLVSTLDAEIESDVFNNAFNNFTRKGDSDFFHNLPVKDEAIFVALVSMAVIIPIIFITLFALYFYKRHKKLQHRRQEMLLRDQPEFSMDDYNTEDKHSSPEGVPDLDFKRLRA